MGGVGGGRGWRRRWPLARFVEQNGLHHAREDLRHVHAHDLRDHLGEADAVLQGLCLHEEVVGELVELPDDLEERGTQERETEP